jgi:hypothetical protein
MIKFSNVALVTISALTLAACGDDSNSNTSTETPAADIPVQYEVILTNLTNGQPISAPAILLHDSGQLWEVGEPASDALELLAESGDSSEVVQSSFIESAASATGGITYGDSATVIVGHTAQVQYLSFASMLGNTNDAFTGLNKVDLSGLAVNDSITYQTVAYDAGTEANTESAETVPGPAGNGEAYNSTRDDINMVTMHPGIVSQDDGLSTSALTYQQKFDNPVMSVTITRTQ